MKLKSFANTVLQPLFAKTEPLATRLHDMLVSELPEMLGCSLCYEARACMLPLCTASKVATHHSETIGPAKGIDVTGQRERSFLAGSRRNAPGETERVRPLLPAT